MKIDLEKQKEFLETLGAIDGQFNAIATTLNNLEQESNKLRNDRQDILSQCQHIDDEGVPSLSGGTIYVWCQICGKLLEEDEIVELENLEP